MATISSEDDAVKSMKRKILNHFKEKDIKLFNVIDEEIKIFSLDTKEKTPNELFQSLCRSIVGQQLSGKAAESIHNRFLTLFPRNNVTPKKVLEFTEHDLRNVGMSYGKARALRDHAQKVLDKRIVYKDIDKKTDVEIKDMLLQIKGVGPWTCEMFLMFSLGKEDIFSPKDLGLQKGIQKVYKLREKPDEIKAENLSKKWAPYRTYASIILWHHLDT
jgi:DNA-3-methyladenine glycosylase II